jgi:hypothetical protein
MSKSISLAGASLKIFINNRVFGIASSISWESDAGRRAIYGLDQITPFELAPGQNRITGRIECLRIRQDGGLEGRGVTVHDDKQLLEKYISIIVIDRLTDTVVLRVDNAAVNRQSWQVENRNLLRGSFEFEGLTWTSESS